MKITTETARTNTLLTLIITLISILCLAGFISIFNHFQAWSEDDIRFFKSFIRGFLLSVGIAIFLWNILAD